MALSTLPSLILQAPLLPGLEEVKPLPKDRLVRKPAAQKPPDNKKEERFEGARTATPQEAVVAMRLSTGAGTVPVAPRDPGQSQTRDRAMRPARPADSSRLGEVCLAPVAEDRPAATGASSAAAAKNELETYLWERAAQRVSEPASSQAASASSQAAPKRAHEEDASSPRSSKALSVASSDGDLTPAGIVRACLSVPTIMISDSDSRGFARFLAWRPSALPQLGKVPKLGRNRPRNGGWLGGRPSWRAEGRSPRRRRQ